jgi:hypothetical protein
MQFMNLCERECYNFSMVSKQSVLVGIVLASVLVSCQASNARPMIFKNSAMADQSVPPTTTAIEAYTVPLNETMMTGLVDLSIPFLVYVGNPSCSSCIQFQPFLRTWILEEKPVVYYLNTLTLIYEPSRLQNLFPEQFSEPFSTPSLYLFKGNQRLFLEKSQPAFYSAGRFKSLLASLLQVGPHRDESLVSWQWRQPMVLLWVNWQTLPNIFFEDWLASFSDRVLYLVHGETSIPLPPESFSAAIDLVWQPNLLFLWQSNPKWVFLNTLTTPYDFELWLHENVL